jgi:uncharacterized SAM-binding protein YcdF (DUF218 family)
MPLTVAILLLLASCVLYARHRGERRGVGLRIAATLAVVLTAHPYTAWVLIKGLERQVPVVPADAAHVRAVDAIVILSGWMREGPDGRPALAEDSVIRTLAGLDLYRQLGGRPVVVTGGPTPRSGGVPLAQVMADRLMAEGVNPADVLVEGHARTTYENGVLTADLLRPRGARRVALVTEALHMPRAIRVFEAQGLAVVPVACNHVALRPPEFPRALLPGAGAAYGVQRGAHEWLGLGWYFLRGRLTPAPVPEGAPHAPGPSGQAFEPDQLPTGPGAPEENAHGHGP